MSDDKSASVVRMMSTVHPVVPRELLSKLQDVGVVDKQGYLDIIMLIEARAQLEREFQLKVTLVTALLGITGAVILKFL